MKLKFDFDPAKSEANKAKHGIDFVAAQELWLSAFESFPAKAANEKRYLEIGTIKDEYWSAIVTYFGGTIRLISVRKSTSEEKALYARAKKSASSEKKT